MDKIITPVQIQTSQALTLLKLTFLLKAQALRDYYGIIGM